MKLTKSMIENITEPFNSIIYGFGAFMISFVALSIFWSMFLKLAESFFSKSKLYFLPKVLKEVNRSIFLAVLLISIYLGIIAYDSTLTDNALMKVWGVILIIVMTEIIAKVLLSTLDHYYIKSRKSPTFLSNALPLMKRVIGVLLYAIAVLIIINYLSYEVGTIVASIGLLIIIFIFIIYYEQLKNIMAGLHLIGAHIREGDYIEILNYKGFVERILEQHVIMRDLDGRTILVPNHIFIKESVKDCCFSEGNMMSLDVKIDVKDIEKAKKRLSVVCGKIGLGLEEVMNDYKPKVFASGIKDGLTRFNVKFIVKPNSDLRRIVDSFTIGMKKEFKEKIEDVKLN